CSPTTLTRAAGIRARTPGSMPSPARRIGTRLILAPAMRRTCTGPAQPWSVASSVARSAVASYASRVASSVTSSRKPLVLSSAERSSPILCWTSGWWTSTAFMAACRYGGLESLQQTRRCGKAKPALRRLRPVRRSERPARRQLVDGPGFLGLQLVLVVVAVELVLEGVELVEELVLARVE